jgi:hypothetical protein
MKKILTLLMTLLALSVLTVRAVAQKDTLAGIRLFMRVCNAYKQLPVQLDLDIRHSANLVGRPDDTAHASARFYLQQRGSYIEMDNMEQVVNDSLMLLVSKPARRMILYAHRQSVANQLSQYLGFGLQDSSLARIAGKFTLVSTASAGDTASIELVSRASLYANLPAVEEITVKYDPVTARPYQVTDTRRKLVMVEKSLYKDYNDRPEWAGKTLSIGDSSFFLIKEVASVYSYRKITHDEHADLPVRIGDRIVADDQGRYRPVKSYADYLLTQQF